MPAALPAIGLLMIPAVSTLRIKPDSAMNTLPALSTATDMGKSDFGARRRAAVPGVVRSSIAGEGGDFSRRIYFADPIVTSVHDVKVSRSIHRHVKGRSSPALVAGPPSPVEPRVPLPATVLMTACP